MLNECTSSFLKVSVCRYTGDTEGRPERLVIAGHNYKSHFGKLSMLGVGDEVCFTGLSGDEYSYSVTGITIIAGNDHAALEAGEWDMTLFTCNSNGTKRILVRCQEVDEAEPANKDSNI